MATGDAEREPLAIQSTAPSTITRFPRELLCLSEMIFRYSLDSYRGSARWKLDDHQPRMRPVSLKRSQASSASNEAPTKGHKRCRHFLAEGIERRLVIDRFGSDHIGLHGYSLPADLRRPRRFL